MIVAHSSDENEIGLYDPKNLALVSFGTFSENTSQTGNTSVNFTTTTNINKKIEHFIFQDGEEQNSNFVIGRFTNTSFSDSENDVGTIFYSFSRACF